MTDVGHLYGFYPRDVTKRRGVGALAVTLFSRLLRQPGTSLTSTLFWGLVGSDLRHKQNHGKISGPRAAKHRSESGRPRLLYV